MDIFMAWPTTLAKTSWDAQAVVRNVALAALANVRSATPSSRIRQRILETGCKCLPSFREWPMEPEKIWQSRLHGI